MALRRLDSELVRRKLARSRGSAQALIEAGQVEVAGQVATKAATQVDTGAPILVSDEVNVEQYVSRGAYKLIGALEALGDLAPTIAGQRCLDAGASTGGFTDVLLQRGAQSVVAVDVGYGQLAWKLRQDSRVELLERTNIRNLTPGQVAPAPTLVVADLSFISLKTVIPTLLQCAPDAYFLLMVKPQFEVGKDRIQQGGVVRDPQLRAEAVEDVARFSKNLGLKIWAIEPSPLPGPAGNVEYFLAMGRHPAGEPIEDITRESRLAVEKGPHPEQKRGNPNG